MTLPGPAAAEALLRYMRDNREHLEPWVMRSGVGGDTVEYWRSELVHDLAEFQAGQSVRLVMLDADERVVGVCNFNQISGKRCFIGCSIDRGLQGRGWMHDAILAALRYMVNERGVTRFEASSFPENERSLKLIRRLRFRIEGISRDAVYFNGAWRDLVRAVLVLRPLSCDRARQAAPSSRGQAEPDPRLKP